MWGRGIAWPPRVRAITRGLGTEVGHDGQLLPPPRAGPSESPRGLGEAGGKALVCPWRSVQTQSSGPRPRAPPPWAGGPEEGGGALSSPGGHRVQESGAVAL